MNKQENNTSSNAQGKMVHQSNANKKKTVIAICLLLLMVFMWIKAFSKKDANPVSAEPLHNQAILNPPEKELVISFSELPDVNGRNDVLTRDFFKVRSWRDFSGGTTSGISNFTEKSDPEKTRQIISKLSLEAIEMNDKPKAFINDRLLGVGDKLQIDGSGNVLECEIMSIEKDKVFLKCMDTEIELKFTR